MLKFYAKKPEKKKKIKITGSVGLVSVPTGNIGSQNTSFSCNNIFGRRRWRRKLERGKAHKTIKSVISFCEPAVKPIHETHPSKQILESSRAVTAVPCE